MFCLLLCSVIPSFRHHLVHQRRQFLAQPVGGKFAYEFFRCHPSSRHSSRKESECGEQCKLFIPICVGCMSAIPESQWYVEEHSRIGVSFVGSLFVCNGIIESYRSAVPISDCIKSVTFVTVGKLAIASNYIRIVCLVVITGFSPLCKCPVIISRSFGWAVIVAVGRRVGVRLIVCKSREGSDISFFKDACPCPYPEW